MMNASHPGSTVQSQDSPNFENQGWSLAITAALPVVPSPEPSEAPKKEDLRPAKKQNQNKGQLAEI